MQYFFIYVIKTIDFPIFLSFIVQYLSVKRVDQPDYFGYRTLQVIVSWMHIGGKGILVLSIICRYILYERAQQALAV